MLIHSLLINTGIKAQVSLLFIKLNKKHCFHGVGAPVSKHVERETQPARLDSDVFRKDYVQAFNADMIRNGFVDLCTEDDVPSFS